MACNPSSMESNALFCPLWAHMQAKHNTYNKNKSFKKICTSQEVLTHAFDLNTGEVETNRSLWIWGQPGLQSKFHDSHSQECTVKPCLEEWKKTKPVTKTTAQILFWTPYLAKEHPIHGALYSRDRTWTWGPFCKCSLWCHTLCDGLSETGPQMLI